MEDTLQALIFYGFVALLLLLRFDAKRFGAADWDDEDANGWRAWARRLSWYAFALGLVLVIYLMHPLPLSVLRLQAGTRLARDHRGRLCARIDWCLDGRRLRVGALSRPAPAAAQPLPGRAADLGRNGAGRRSRFPRRPARPAACVQLAQRAGRWPAGRPVSSSPLASPAPAEAAAASRRSTSSWRCWPAA